jgi:hypothetical protein
VAAAQQRVVSNVRGLNLHPFPSALHLHFSADQGEDQVRLLMMTTALACFLAGPAGAETFRAAGVQVRDAAALLTVMPEDRTDVDATMMAGARLPAPTVRLQGDQLVIDGGLRVQGCGGWFQSGPRSSIRVAGYGAVSPDQLQRITLHVPRTLNLSVGGGVHSTIGSSRGGRVELSGCGASEIADAQGALDLTLNGSGDVRLGNVSGALRAALNGSGDVAGGRVGSDATLSLTGSGDLGVGDVGGALDARLLGSGNLRAGAVSGAHLQLRGSGDVSVGEVRGPLSASLDGSGNIAVRSAQATTMDLQLSSSGDVRVRGGHADALDVTNSGSGNVSFNGRAEASRLALSGSGDVSVDDAGHIDVLHDSGSGGIHVGK